MSNLYYLPSGAGTIVARSGAVYQSNVYGFITNVANSDVVDLEQAGAFPVVPAGGSIAFKNAIDGGDFTTNPWQRGTTFTAITNSIKYTADRWFAIGGASSSIDVSQASITSVPGLTKALQFGRDSGNSDTAVINLGQVLETLDCIRFQGLPVTLSFYAAVGAGYSGGNLTVALNHSTTAGNDTAAHLAAASTNWQAVPSLINAAQALTTTMQRYTFTGIVPSNCTQLGLLLSYTPAGSGAANDYIQFAGVQLEYGELASAFEHRDVVLELELAQRYAFVAGGSVGVVGTGAATSTSASGFYIPFPTPMRAAPTALAITTVGDLSVYTYANASVAALTALTFASASPNGVHATATCSGTPLTSGLPYVLFANTALAGNVVLSADL